MFRLLITLSVFLFLASCSSPYLNSSFEQNAKVGHQGYCMKHYDELGSSICSYIFADGVWKWDCDPVPGEYKPNSARSSKCIEWKQKWQLIFA